jgi:hypothetical protein
MRALRIYALEQLKQISSVHWHMYSWGTIPAFNNTAYLIMVNSSEITEKDNRVIACKIFMLEKGISPITAELLQDGIQEMWDYIKYGPLKFTDKPYILTNIGRFNFPHWRDEKATYEYNTIVYELKDFLSTETATINRNNVF